MPLHKTPGEDGFPTEFYRAYGALLAPLLTEMYEDCLEAEEMHPHMRSATVSLIYKAKGSRLSWKNYRPIAVSCVEYKILAKAMQLSMDDVLQHVISPSQVGFQRGKYIGEATALVQLLTELCARRGQPGLLLMLDGAQAYDRVQWDWLFECLDAMQFPASFCRLVRLLYTQPELAIKVNGVVDTPFSVANGLRQGCPCSPLFYLVSLQPLIDFLESSAAPEGFGVVIPGPKGDASASQEARAVAYADDLTVCMSGFSSLAALRVAMDLYHDAAGADTNWGKTVGLRLGTSRGLQPPSSPDFLSSIGKLADIRWTDAGTDAVHVGCEVDITGLPAQPTINFKSGVVVAAAGAAWSVDVDGQQYMVPVANLTVTASRYLGIWLGGSKAVRLAWEKRVLSKMNAKLAALDDSPVKCRRLSYSLTFHLKKKKATRPPQEGAPNCTPVSYQ